MIVKFVQSVMAKKSNFGSKNNKYARFVIAKRSISTRTFGKKMLNSHYFQSQKCLSVKKDVKFPLFPVAEMSLGGKKKTLDSHYFQSQKCLGGKKHNKKMLNSHYFQSQKCLGGKKNNKKTLNSPPWYLRQCQYQVKVCVKSPPLVIAS